jgi:exopolysaccharide biosynthesis polyprenyl glycosylphosphotransferase
VIRRYLAILRLLLMTLDGISAVVLFNVLIVVRFQLLDANAAWNVSIDQGVAAVAYAIVWVASLWILGLYRLRTHVSFRGEAIGILRAGVLAPLAMFTALFLLGLDHGSRLFVILLVVCQPPLTISLRFALRRFLAWMRSQGRMTRRMLIVGAGSEASAFADEVVAQRELGLQIVGHLRGPNEHDAAGRRPVLGTLDDIERVLHEQVVDEVAICLSPADWSYVEPITRICEEEGKVVRVSMRALGGTLEGGLHDEIGETPIMTFLYGPDRMLGLLLKRFADIVISALVLIVLSPVMLLIALYIKAFDGSPILFRHQRVGLHGRLFTCLKFRTMVPNAENMQESVMHLNLVKGPAFKIPDDPRITRSGRFLRRTGLDELPQLINVLRGEMSIVGPRPAPPREVANYSVWHRRRLMMRPGLTGFWQVEARSNDNFDERAQLDLEYIDRWSLWMDFKIMVRTIPAIIQQQGR